jgi:hypothetical protein
MSGGDCGPGSALRNHLYRSRSSNYAKVPKVERGDCSAVALGAGDDGGIGKSKWKVHKLLDEIGTAPFPAEFFDFDFEVEWYDQSAVSHLDFLFMHRDTILHR